METPQAAKSHIKFDADGKPYIEAQRCRACGAMLAEPHLACPACASRKGFDAIRAKETGRLIAYSIVKRSYPGIQTPFVSAMVELDDGLALKANLVGAGFEPEGFAPNMKVRLRFNDALGRKDKEGRAYVGYEFQPAVN
ncbi:MAG TPA: OB-fold domain-containing protein [Caulobacterales bacterium]|nr:OB-fold domain-containing protein [Caulobacterales bacterium]